MLDIFFYVGTGIKFSEIHEICFVKIRFGNMNPEI
jgi:hypothetical protein